jgi:glycosyltransferase involved in cell wall biosynthesis
MKILIVASFNSGKFSPFITEQVETLLQFGINVDYFGIQGKGIGGYLACRFGIVQKINDYRPDIIHAHYGLSGLMANLQRKIPVITTYHGSDLNLQKNIFFSKLSIFLSIHNIFVSTEFIIKNAVNRKYSYLPCGVNLSLFKPINNYLAREQLGFAKDKKLVLFSSSFSNEIKNYDLASQAILQCKDVELIELKGYSRNEVSLLINAADTVLLTSFSEGSPQIIKEAMACNRPIVTTNVGDVKWVIGDTEGCYITSYNVEDCAEKIKKAIQFSIEKKETNGRDRIIEIGLDNELISQKLKTIYESILSI